MNREVRRAIIERKPSRFGLRQSGIVILAVLTGIIHLMVGLIPVQPPDLPFVLHGIGYIVLVGLLFLPVPQLDQQRALIRWILMVYTTVTVFAGTFVGVRGSVGLRRPSD